MGDVGRSVPTGTFVRILPDHARLSFLAPGSLPVWLKTKAACEGRLDNHRHSDDGRMCHPSRAGIDRAVSREGGPRVPRSDGGELGHVASVAVARRQFLVARRTLAGQRPAVCMERLPASQPGLLGLVLAPFIVIVAMLVPQR